LIGEAYELDGTQILRGRLSLLDFTVQVFELAKRTGRLSLAELSK
jgi:hypothetical protein